MPDYADCVIAWKRYKRNVERLTAAQEAADNSLAEAKAITLAYCKENGIPLLSTVKRMRRESILPERTI